MGKIVHYHFDKLSHFEKPKQQSSNEFLVMKQETHQSYQIDKEDFPYLRARPCWISPDEKEERIQNEVNIFVNVFASVSKLTQTLGRSSKCDI